METLEQDFAAYLNKLFELQTQLNQMIKNEIKGSERYLALTVIEFDFDEVIAYMQLAQQSVNSVQRVYDALQKGVYDTKES